MKFTSDIDIDLADRQLVLDKISYIAASIEKDGELTLHASGIYPTEIPRDPFTGRAALDYKIAEQRGYIKLDLLNVSVYSLVSSEQHLTELMSKEPPWHRLYEEEFCQQVIHIGNHYNTLIQMPEAVNSIEKMSMFLAVIRPAKRHLIGRTWAEIEKSIWEKPTDGGYAFKKAHGVAYSHLVCVHMNLLSEVN